ncbi:MAG: thermonuclease family protein [Pseudomonadota bacterium]
MILTCFVALACASAPLSGRVVGVSDGDTITVLAEGRRPVRVRLAEIDTPESRQPWGKRAKQALSHKVFDQQVVVEVLDVDRYGRSVGRVRLGKRDINREMVSEGHAWVYRDYLRDRSLLDVEAEAREARRGLWSLGESDRLEPWLWRRRHKRR